MFIFTFPLVEHSSRQGWRSQQKCKVGSISPTSPLSCAAYAMAALNYAQENGVRINNKLQDAIFDLSVGMAENTYEKGRAEAGQYLFGFNLPTANAFVYNQAGNIRQVFRGKDRTPIATPHRHARKSKQ